MAVVLADEVVDGKAGTRGGTRAFFTGEDGLVGKVRDEERVFAFFVGEGRRLSEDGEDDGGLPVLVDSEHIPIFCEAVDLGIDDDGGSQFVGVLGDLSAFLQSLQASLALHSYY